ncbi:MAG: TetR/AcrR family transcriptional regulator [Candidatus Spyradosoma sp.]
MDKKTKTEAQILSAAKKVFIAKGLEATSMSDIAGEAGISRPSLHYYFRTKENLFLAIFKDIIEEFMPQLGEIIRGSETPEAKVRLFVNKYVDLLAGMPMVPHFVINQIYRDPEGMAELFLSVESRHGNIAYAVKLIDEFAKKQKLKNFDAQSFCLSLYGQCIFPFLVSPILKAALLDRDPERYRDVLEQHKKTVIRNAMLSLKIKVKE